MRRWVIVGAGAAGCVMASRLAEQVADEVVLLEAGPADPPASIRGTDVFAALAEPGWTYPEPFTRGRGVGGSSAVNGMLATAGSLDQYRSWGWDDAGSALGAVRVPLEEAGVGERGPLDVALLAAAPDATSALLTRRAGRRVTAAEAYLAGSSVDVRAGHDVVRLVVDGRRVAGVELAGGEVVVADRVVVTAGAIGTPVLLLRSGIGTAGVGHGLRNHIGVPVLVHLWPGISRGGAVGTTVLRRDDLQIVPFNHLGVRAPDTAMLLAVAMSPTGRGQVRIDDDGGVVVEQVLTDHDRSRAAAGVELVEGLLTHDAFRALVDEVEVGTAPAGVFHPTSTCAPGVVVDDAGAVYGYDDLFVADASVFPDIPIANTYLPTLMLAERLARRLVALAS